jgi:hypothetical protein
VTLSQRKSAIWALALLSSACATPSNAVTVHDSITGTYYTGGYRTVGDTFGFMPVSHSAGVRFTTSVTGYIESLTLSLYGAPSATVQVFSDNGGKLGVSLDTLALNANTGAGTFATGSYSSGVMLQAGTSYWILATEPSPVLRWEFRGFIDPRRVEDFTGTSLDLVPVVTTGTYFMENNSISGYGLIVDVAAPDPVPLPAALPLFGTVIAAGSLVAWRKRRKAAQAA